MCRYAIAILALSLCVLPAAQTQAKSDESADVPTISMTKRDITDKTLKLTYEIRNASDEDIWICGGFNGLPGSFEVLMAQDGETLLIRRRFDVPIKGYSPALPYALYVRLRKGHTREESLLLSLPVRPYRVLSEGGRTVRVIEHAKSVTLEIDFYSGDLPGMIFGLLEEAEKDPQKKHVDEHGRPTDVVGWLDSSIYFNRINENFQDREEEVIMPWTNQTLKGARVIRATSDDVNIPYLENPSRREFKPLKLGFCTKIEVVYQPSMLDYLFPYPTQQHLLSLTEAKQLQSHSSVVVGNQDLIGALAAEINRPFFCGQIATCPRSAHVVCYHEDERLTSFIVYGDSSVETQDGQCLSYLGGMQSMKLLAPEVEQFELRIECGGNLRNLWRRLRLYRKAVGQIQMLYPAPVEWSDAMVRAYMKTGLYNETFADAYVCPSAGEGKCHYAMNSDCKPDSPADMVLLFETKAGWNQHGGPELFTFDNHDPKGGCVLLNDGTVKFIRTKEELQQLRWE